MSSIPPKQFRWLSITILVIGAAWIFASAPEPGALQQAQSEPTTGFLAPDFTLQTFEGTSITLSDLRGQAVLVNLWASWCGPCRAEMPAMEKVYLQYKDQGFQILAVNASNQDNLANAQAFVEELGITYPILLDTNGQVSSLYQLRALPTTFFISPAGYIEEVVIGGPMSEALLSIRAAQLVAELP